MEQYARNLQRLEKAIKLVRLAIKSGTLRDRDWGLESLSRIEGALHLLENGAEKQKLYLIERWNDISV